MAEDLSGEQNKGPRLEEQKGAGKLTEGTAIIGLRMARQNFAEIVDRALHGFEEILLGNVKRGGETTVSLLSTEVVDELLNLYRFTPVCRLDGVTGQWEVLIPELGTPAGGCGDTKEEAIASAVEAVIALMEDYFADIELYMRIPEYRRLYGYHLRLKRCKDAAEVRAVLGL